MNRFHTTTVSLLCLGFAATATSSAPAHRPASAPPVESASELTPPTQANAAADPRPQ